MFLAAVGEIQSQLLLASQKAFVVFFPSFVKIFLLPFISLHVVFPEASGSFMLLALQIPDFFAFFQLLRKQLDLPRQ